MEKGEFRRAVLLSDRDLTLIMAMIERERYAPRGENVDEREFAELYVRLQELTP